MNIQFILVAMIVFYLIHNLLDALHDVWGLKERQKLVAAEKTVNQEKKKALRKEAKKYAQRWHWLDAVIKGFAGAVVAFAFTGLSWWVPIFALLGASIRWLWFDIMWNVFAGMPILYIGSTAKTDSLSKSKYVLLGVKLFFLTVAVVLIVLKLKNKI